MNRYSYIVSSILSSFLKSFSIVFLYYLTYIFEIDKIFSIIFDNNIYNKFISILNLLMYFIICFKIYIAYYNFRNLSNNIFDIQNISKKFFTIYFTTLNLHYIYNEDYNSLNDENFIEYNDLEYHGDYNNINSIDNIIDIKKINITYMRDLIILYISNILLLNSNNKTDSIFFKDCQKINNYLLDEIQIISYDYIYNKEIIISFIEYLVLKNLNMLKNNDYIDTLGYNNLIDEFNKLQYVISNIQKSSYYRFSNKFIFLHLRYLTNIIFILNIFSIVNYYKEINNQYILILVLIISIISFLIFLLDNTLNIFINSFNNIDKLFNCHRLIHNINNDLYILNYFYISNKDYNK